LISSGKNAQDDMRFRKKIIARK